MTPKVNSLAPSEPVSFLAYGESAGEVSMPRFYGVALFGKAEEERLTDGDVLDGLVFDGELLGEQQAAHDAVVAQARASGGAMLVLGCGGGKTVIALRVLLTLGRTAIIFVHKSFLMDQWRERLRTFVPVARVGVIRQSHVDVEGKDVVLAMIQSVAKRAYAPAVFERFGVAVFDECHHMAAPHFFGVLSKIRPRYVVGLTATEERADGLTRLLRYGLGEPLYFSRSADECPVAVRLVAYGNGGGDVRNRRGQINLMSMHSALARDGARNALLVGQIVGYARDPARHTLVLSALLSHLDELFSLLHAHGVTDVGVLTGATPARRRTDEMSKRVLLSTYAMAREALDVPSLNTLVFATPGAEIEQAVGRIQRGRASSEPEREVVDLVDERATIYRALAAKRLKFYRSKRFRIV